MRNQDKGGVNRPPLFVSQVSSLSHVCGVGRQSIGVRLNGRTHSNGSNASYLPRRGRQPGPHDLLLGIFCNVLALENVQDPEPLNELPLCETQDSTPKVYRCCDGFNPWP